MYTGSLERRAPHAHVAKNSKKYTGGMGGRAPHAHVAKNSKLRLVLIDFGNHLTR